MLTGGMDDLAVKQNLFWLMCQLSYIPWVPEYLLHG